ncbi:hypothetical protein V6N12_062827 [Hibiscus sabdariffa]|uniref:Uncharacterized protein n=1 Tax=Hibiscus sabdariffa TaxID=183260 RepID=A0ABR2FA02_9ROSI
MLVWHFMSSRIDTPSLEMVAGDRWIVLVVCKMRISFGGVGVHAFGRILKLKWKSKIVEGSREARGVGLCR